MTKKILIIGNSIKELALAKLLSKTNEVFVAPGNNFIKDFATCIDIREDSIAEILEFVMENDIELTLPISNKSLKTNIVELFNKNNQKIFAPSLDNTKLFFDKAFTKKLLYKLRIPTPKFGIFEKQNMAYDYIKNLNKPFVIKTNEPSSAVVLTSQKSGKLLLDSFYAKNGQKVIIEDYIWGTPFSFYIISDGYKALPIGSSIIYKHALEGDGGQLTSGMGSCSPNYKLSYDNECYIMENIVYPILEYQQANNSPYLGIMAINGILTENNNIEILGLDGFMHDIDTTSILEILDTDLINLIESCLIGSFSDEVESISQKDLCSTSIVLTCKNKENKENVIYGLEFLDEDTSINFYPNISKNRYLEYEAQAGNVLVITTFGRTITSSTEKAYEEAQNIKFNGVYYRKDIAKPSLNYV